MNRDDIRQRIYDLYRAFRYNYRMEPNALYVGFQEYFEIIKNPQIVGSYLSIDNKKFMNLEMIIVKEEHALQVGIIIKETRIEKENNNENI